MKFDDKLFKKNPQYEALIKKTPEDIIFIKNSQIKILEDRIKELKKIKIQEAQ